jgi:hypothetical protein
VGVRTSKYGRLGFEHAYRTAMNDTRKVRYCVHVLTRLYNAIVFFLSEFSRTPFQPFPADRRFRIRCVLISTTPPAKNIVLSCTGQVDHCTLSAIKNSARDRDHRI